MLHSRNGQGACCFSGAPYLSFVKPCRYTGRELRGGYGHRAVGSGNIPGPLSLRDRLEKRVQRRLWKRIGRTIKETEKTQ